MPEAQKTKAEPTNLRIDKIPEEMAEAYKQKLHISTKTNPNTNYFKKVLRGRDIESAREMIAYLINMEESPWGQIEDDDKTQADIYSSHLRIIMLMRLVRQAKVVGDGKTPRDIDIAQMMLATSDPKDDLKTLARLQDILKNSRLAEAVNIYLDKIKGRIAKTLTLKWEEV